MSPVLTDPKALSLREEFDRSFSQSANEARSDHVDFLTVRIAGDRYALRLWEIQSLHAERNLVRVPSLLPELLGFLGFRGVLTPVYDLAQVLGYPGGLAARGLFVARSEQPIAFAFGEFESHLRVRADRISQPEPGTRTSVEGLVSDEDGSRLPLVNLPLLIENIAARIKALRPSQER